MKNEQTKKHLFTTALPMLLGFTLGLYLYHAFVWWFFGQITGALALAVLFKLLQIQAALNKKKYRHGQEHGSAVWGTKSDILPYQNKDPYQNVILTKTESLNLKTPPNPEYGRNKNICVIGGSGSGKTRFMAKPNLMQLHSSYCVTDPKGTILLECGHLLHRAKYRIKVFNTIDFSKSMKYNPLAYIRSEKDILKLVTALIANTEGEGAQKNEDFWVKSEKLVYTSLIGYIWYEAPKEEKNLNTLVELINSMEVREDDETFQNPVDIMMATLAAKDPEHFAVRQYAKFKLASGGKTAKSILISCGARLAPFDIKELRDITEYDEMELDTLGDRKTALFVIVSDSDTTFNFLAAIMYSQLFNLLCDKADVVYGGKLPVHVRFILDEFANIGKIPNFETLIATIRSREISATIILQNMAQLKSMYKDNASTILGNCDTMLFLGGKEKETLKEISEVMGKGTIDSFNTSVTRSNQSSHGQNYQKLGRELMTIDEIAKMPGSKCIMMLRGCAPFFSDKYPIEKHPRYKYLADANPKLKFDVSAYLNRHRLKVQPSDRYDVLEI